MSAPLTHADRVVGLVRTALDAAAHREHEQLALADLVSWVEASGAEQTDRLYQEAAARLADDRSPGSAEARRWLLRLAALVGGIPALPTQGRARERIALR